MCEVQDLRSETGDGEGRKSVCEGGGRGLEGLGEVDGIVRVEFEEDGVGGVSEGRGIVGF